MEIKVIWGAGRDPTSRFGDNASRVVGAMGWRVDAPAGGRNDGDYPLICLPWYSYIICYN